MPRKEKRKCLKCGATSEDPGIVLYRFPKPGATNAARCESWARLCFPNNRMWSSIEFQKKLYSEHRMLCHKHFNQSVFIDFDKKSLHRHAAPSQECDVMVPVSNVNDPSPLDPGPSSGVLANITNVRLKELDYIVAAKHAQVQQAGDENIPGSSTAVLQDHHYVTNVGSEEPRVTDFVQSDKKQQVPELTKEHANVSKTKKLIKKICQLRTALKKSKALRQTDILRILSDESDIKKLQKVISPHAAVLLQGQVRNFSKKAKGRRWTSSDKIIALRLYKRSPTCYRLLRRLFCLPAPVTLKRMLQHFVMKPGINKKVLTTIKKYIDRQKPSDNQFVVMFDEMNIRKNIQYNKKSDNIDGYQDHGHHGRTEQEAVKALVFMVAGIRKSVKQPLAYYLSGANVTADRLMVLIKETLLACFNAGLNVSAVVCDMAATNRRALGSLGASEDNPVFTLSSREVVALFDVPHLLKCFRNMFMKYDMKCKIDISSGETTGEGVAKWSDIRDFYEIDSKNPNFVYAPSLKKEHLDPNTKQKMKVKLAAQVLSSSVAGGMFAQISQGLLPATAIVTANVVLKMDKLFDLCNSSSPDLRRGKPHSRNMADTSPHLDYFKDMKKFFKEIRFQGCPRTPPSIEGWLWTMNGIEKLWFAIKKNYPDVKSMATRRLQQDPLENLFGCIRGNCGSNSNPTTSAFVGGLKTAVLSNLAHVSSGNCEDDGNQAIMDNFKMLLSDAKEPKDTSADLMPLFEQAVDVNEMEETNESEDSAELQACAYVCGYLIKNLKNKSNKCQQCDYIFVAQVPSAIHNFVENKEYNSCKNSLNYATKDLVMCVEQCAGMINALLSKESHKNNLKKSIIDQLPIKKFDFLHGCSVHFEKNKEYLEKAVFHICVHRYCTLKNRQFAAEYNQAALRKKIEILKNK